MRTHIKKKMRLVKLLVVHDTIYKYITSQHDIVIIEQQQLNLSFGRGFFLLKKQETNKIFRCILFSIDDFKKTFLFTNYFFYCNLYLK